MGLLSATVEDVIVPTGDPRAASITQPGIDIGALAARLHVARIRQVLLGDLEGQSARLPDVAGLRRHGDALVALPCLDLANVAQLLGIGHVLQHLGDGQDVDVGSVGIIIK